MNLGEEEREIIVEPEPMEVPMEQPVEPQKEEVPARGALVA